MNNDQKVAIITARGGSKRIPRKNIREFCGKPIIAYSIQVALASGIFDEVMVSTDDIEIAEISKKYGASVPFMRTEENANDYATSYDVVEEVLQNYKQIGRKFKYACCIYPTAPFITVSKLKRAMEIMEREKADTVFPVVMFSYPPQRGLVMKGKNMRFLNPENALVRSQDLQQVYHDAGQFYFLDVKEFMKQKKMIMDRTCPIIIDEMEMQDIDNEIDWTMAEIKYRFMVGNNEDKK